MEKQYSVQFFNSFVEHLQRSCQNYVTFGQLVEVSGYLSLEIDGVKKERYVLSELIQTTGTVISESYCTKVSRNCTTVPRPQAQTLQGKMSKVSPGIPQMKAGGRMGNTSGQTHVNRMSQIQQTQRGVQNSQMSSTGQKQVTAKSKQESGKMVRQMYQVNRREQNPVNCPQVNNQGPMNSPHVNRQGPINSSQVNRQIPVNCSQANQQNNSRRQMANSSNKQMFNSKLNQNVSKKEDRQNSNISSQGRILKPNSESRTSNASASGVEQHNSKQNQPMTSPVPVAEQQVFHSAQSEQIHGSHTQINIEPNQKVQQQQDYTDCMKPEKDVYVLGITKGSTSMEGTFPQGQLSPGHKECLSHKATSVSHQGTVLSTSFQTQSGMKSTVVPSKHSSQTQSLTPVPTVTHSIPNIQSVKMLVTHEQSNGKFSDINPSPDSTVMQKSPPVLIKAPMTGSLPDIPNRTTMPSLKLEVPFTHKVFPRKPVILESPCKKSPSGITSDDHLFFQPAEKFKDSTLITNNVQELLPDAENQPHVKDNHAVKGGETDQKISSHAPCPQNISTISTSSHVMMSPCVVTLDSDAAKPTSSTQGPSVCSSADQSIEPETGKVKKLRLSSEADEGASTSCTKPKVGKGRGRKLKEKVENKNRRGRRRTSRGKNVEQSDLTSDEDTSLVNVPPASRTLRTRNLARRLYTEDELSDGLEEFLIKDAEQEI